MFGKMHRDMKTKGSVLVILLVVCGALLAFINNHPFEELSLNSPIPLTDIKMKDVSGKAVCLDDIKTSKGTLVIFSCNTCPFVRKMEGRIREVTEICARENIGCVLINSNEGQRDGDDSFESMKAYYKEQGLSCFYTVDEKSRLANAFGAGRTPQCFLFNGDGKLVYKGAIDDNVKDATLVKEAYLKNAISAVLSNEKPPVRETKSIGCTIKRVE